MVAVIRPRKARFYLELTSAKYIGDAISYAIRSKYPVRVVGMPGTGKTTALEHFAQKDGYAYCQVGASQKGVRGLYQMVLTACGLYVPKAATITELADGVYSLGANMFFRCLIVDEYQTLEPAVLRELLNIQESAELSLILAGNGETIVQRRTDGRAMEQINDRIAMTVEIDGPTPEDCAQVAVAYNVVGNDAFKAVRNFGANTNLRQLCAVLDEAEDLAYDGIDHLIHDGAPPKIALVHIENALLLKRGRREALRLLEAPIN